MQESVDRVITLKDDNLDDVRRMLDYLYSKDFWEFPLEERENPNFKSPFSTDRLHWRMLGPPPTEKPAERSKEERNADPLIVCMRMFSLANKYEIPGLRLPEVEQVPAAGSCYGRLRCFVEAIGKAQGSIQRLAESDGCTWVLLRRA